MPFEIDNYIYDSDLIIAYCSQFKPKMTKIPMDDALVLDNLEKKEWYTKQFKNGISPMDVIDNPRKHKNHYQRMINADMKYPIIVWKEKKLVVDGNHRLGSAFLHDDKFVKAYIFNTALMKKFRIGKFETRKEYLEIVENINPSDLINLFYKRFCN